MNPGKSKMIKIMRNFTSGIMEIKLNSVILKNVVNFKYLGTTMRVDDGVKLDKNYN